MKVFDPTTIYYDNLRNIQLAKNPIFHARTKHIEVHYHFLHFRLRVSLERDRLKALDRGDRRVVEVGDSILVKG